MLKSDRQQTNIAKMTHFRWQNVYHDMIV